MNIILACSCGGSKKNAEIGFSTIYPNQPFPDIILGKDRIFKFANSLVPPNDHIKAIAKLSGKFAYYIKLDENNNITEEYDLYSGRRIA